MWDYRWTELAVWNISPCCRFNFAQGDRVSSCCYRKACRTYCVCHLQGHWMNWGCMLLEHWNVWLIALEVCVRVPVVIMTSVSAFSLPSCYSTLAMCCSPTCHCCSSDACLSCSNLTFLFVISPDLILSMALQYLLIMETSSFCPCAYGKFTCDFDKRRIYILWLGLWIGSGTHFR
jgi:hypothetical protein